MRVCIYVLLLFVLFGSPELAVLGLEMAIYAGPGISRFRRVSPVIKRVVRGVCLVGGCYCSISGCVYVGVPDVLAVSGKM